MTVNLDSEPRWRRLGWTSVRRGCLIPRPADGGRTRQRARAVAPSRLLAFGAQRLPIGIVITVVSVILIVHAAKTGRFWPWGFIILFLPLAGAIAYVLVELVPQWLGSSAARRAGGRFAGAVDPTRRYRRLQGELDLVDTIANRAALAEECLALGKFDEALAHYDAILAKPQGDEPAFMLGKARAEYGLGNAAAALSSLTEIERRWPDYRSVDARLLLAMALEQAGRAEEALAAYADVAATYPGVEPRVRQAQLLQRLGREAEARAVAEEVARSLGRAPAHVRRRQAEWLAAARRIAGA